LSSTTSEDVEYECTVAATELATTVRHVNEVLCHRSGEPLGLSATGGQVVEQALRRRGESAEVRTGGVQGTHSIRRAVPQGARASIIIPFRDEPRLLRTCLESLAATTTQEQVDYVLIDNGSSDLEIATLLERLESRPDVHVLSDDRPFNWASLNNVGAEVASGDVLVFLNNDIEARRQGWLGGLMAHALRADVGAVGARLLYPDGRLQHGGVVIGLIGAAGHVLLGLDESAPGYLNMATVTRECAAVTGACLATRREVFEHLGGFDETLGVDLNDVDYCLRASASGFRTVYEPSAELTHHESPSRGTAGGVGDLVRFVERWEGYIAGGDPFLNRNLTRRSPSCGLREENEEDAWMAWYATVRAQ
jgi:GT2 family glycosyltransferase